MSCVLITGVTGQVGHALKMRSSTVEKMFDQVVFVGRSELNLASQSDMEKFLDVLKPTVIINPAAYTAVDQAESDCDAAMLVNTQAPTVLAQWAKRNNALLIHYSTDYVFDGKKIDPYNESDPTSPQSVYGSTKLGGEKAILESRCDHIIFRTSWVYGAFGKNFLKTILRLSMEKSELRVVADQFGTPTSAGLIADVTLQALQKYLSSSHESKLAYHGLYHLTARESTNWCEFARLVVTEATKYTKLKVTPSSVYPISSCEYPTPASRPVNSRLDTTKLTSVFEIQLPSWKEGVASSVSEFLAQPLN